MPVTINGSLGELLSAERNRYFYGKLMGVDQFEKEQHYFNGRRALINRLVIGTGVVCGLNVTLDPDDPSRIRIEPGMAVDGRGCEIVVPEAVAIDPHQLTDGQGGPEGEPVDTGTVEIRLLYSEAEDDPVPVLVPDCDTPGNCAYCTIREEFRVLVRLATEETPEPLACTLGEFPLPANGALYEGLCQRLSETCPPIPEDTSVPLARVTLPLDEQSIAPCVGRPLVYHNALLYELILCLADRVASLGQGRFLRYVSGDGQIGTPEQALPAPITVELVDGAGNAIGDATVQFEVTAGGGEVDAPITQTDPQGHAMTSWRLGTDEGEQRVTASAVGTSFTVTFRATTDSP